MEKLLGTCQISSPIFPLPSLHFPILRELCERRLEKQRCIQRVHGSKSSLLQDWASTVLTVAEGYAALNWFGKFKPNFCLCHCISDSQGSTIKIIYVSVSSFIKCRALWDDIKVPSSEIQLQAHQELQLQNCPLVTSKHISYEKAFFCVLCT